MNELSIKHEKMCDAFYDEKIDNIRSISRRLTKEIWKACLEANGLDSPNAHIVNIDWDSRPWATEVRIGYCSAGMKGNPGLIGDRIDTIPRPIPAWKPKEGEPVFFWNSATTGVPEVGIYYKGKIFAGGRQYAFESQLSKPFDVSMIGKSL